MSNTNNKANTYVAKLTVYYKNVQGRVWIDTTTGPVAKTVAEAEKWVTANESYKSKFLPDVYVKHRSSVYIL